MEGFLFYVHSDTKRRDNFVILFALQRIYSRAKQKGRQSNLRKELIFKFFPSQNLAQQVQHMKMQHIIRTLEILKNQKNPFPVRAGF